jgi:hypothetical protein
MLQGADENDVSTLTVNMFAALSSSRLLSVLASKYTISVKPSPLAAKRAVKLDP